MKVTFKIKRIRKVSIKAKRRRIGNIVHQAHQKNLLGNKMTILKMKTLHRSRIRRRRKIKSRTANKIRRMKILKKNLNIERNLIEIKMTKMKTKGMMNKKSLRNQVRMKRKNQRKEIHFLIQNQAQRRLTVSSQNKVMKTS